MDVNQWAILRDMRTLKKVKTPLNIIDGISCCIVRSNLPNHALAKNQQEAEHNNWSL